MSLTIHGEKPSHWDEEYAFLYELRFVEEPSDSVCAALARAWEAHCAAKGSPASAGGWTFSREFAYLLAVPTNDNHKKLFSHVATFLRAVHADIAPLVEAVHLTAAEDYDGLAPGPDHEASQRPVDPAYPPPSKRDAFEDAVAAITLAAKQARFAKILAAPPKGCLGLAITSPVAPIDDDDVAANLRALYVPDDGMRFAGAASHPLRVPVGGVLYYESIYLMIGGEPGEVTMPDGLETPAISAPHPAGKWVALWGVGDEADQVLIVDPSHADPRSIWTSDEGESIKGLAWLSGDHLAVPTDERVVVLDVPAAGPARELHAKKGALPRLTPCLGGRLIHIVNKGFLAWNGTKLSSVSRFKIDRMYFVSDAGGQVVVRHGYDPDVVRPDDTFLTLTNLEPVLAAQATPKRNKG